MTEGTHRASQSGPSHRTVESGVAVAIGLFASIVIFGSLKAGIDWGVEGPRAGFFPFYVGLTILIASIVNFIHARSEPAEDRFADWEQLRQVLAVVAPTAVYVAVMPWIGIYVSSALLIAFFMKRLANYPWHLIAAIALGVPLATFLVFEKWFLVPLPKGPLETWLGY
jgi:putative tricarboxylic transport membrane protein